MGPDIRCDRLDIIIEGDSTVRIELDYGYAWILYEGDDRLGEYDSLEEAIVEGRKKAGGRGSWEGHD